MAKRLGRRKGARTKGFFYRSGRGWVTKEAGRFVPLTDEHGERLRDQATDLQKVREAHARFLLDRTVEPEKAPVGADTEVGRVCAVYLDHLKLGIGEIGPNPTGKAKTYVDRGQTLFDFCYGLPGEYFCAGDKEKREERKQQANPETKRIHQGFGDQTCSEIKPGDVDSWLKAHKNWTSGGWRTRVQALKRAFNFGVERKLIEVSPIRGYNIPKSTARITYLTPDQETAMIDVASASFAIALRVCIRTGARFGCEFAALCASHVRDHGDKMEWVFKPDESKTGKLRIIRITDTEILRIVREALAHNPVGPIFRNQKGDPWTRKMLSQNFRRAKARVEAKGVQLDSDACMYSCRHSYAKRTLEGYWSVKPASIKTLARLMGNSVQVCIQHYLQFSEADNEMLWGAA